MAKDEVVYTEPNDRADLAKRQEAENASPRSMEYVAPESETEDQATARDYGLEEKDAANYIGGISPEYQNSADPMSVPIPAEEGPDKITEEAFKDSLGLGEEGVTEQEAQSTKAAREKMEAGKSNEGKPDGPNENAADDMATSTRTSSQPTSPSNQKK